MPKHKIAATYTATWTETTEVEVPEGLTATTLDAWLGRWLEANGPRETTPYDADTECDEAEVFGYKFAPLDLSLQPVPAAGWYEVDGARWATDGALAVREGSPMPSAMQAEFGKARAWKTTADVPADRLAALVRGAHRERLDARRYDPRMAPMLTGAEAFSMGGANDPTYVYRDGTLVALVMPPLASWVLGPMVNATGTLIPTTAAPAHTEPS